MTNPPVILYTYPESPFGQKLSLVLLLKRVPYSLVKVARMPPRDELDVLGVKYRRIPVLAVGNDVYFDTSLAILALERVFPDTPLLTTSPSKPGIEMASARFWADTALFRMASSLLPWEKMPKEFVRDRSGYMGAKISVRAMVENRPKVLSALRAHLTIIENQLSPSPPSTPYILRTPTPTYLDISLYFSLNWASKFPTTATIFGSTSTDFPAVKNWMKRIDELVKDVKEDPKTPKVTVLTGVTAARIIHAAASHYALAASGDPNDPLLYSAGVGGTLEFGEMVEVAPEDTGRLPVQEGRLVGLDAEQVVVEVEGRERGEDGRFGVCRVHAPRLGFTVQRRA
ncbi:hypothetical protein MNV49_007302 [Pseudohyphozyma bogoriensis]|nr:hypothetical protein MNV49_007302 [Pseudohyphozyma bogoriensis]